MPLEGAHDGHWAEGAALKRTPDTDGRRDRVRRTLVLVAIVLLAANLRPAITSVAPLIERIRADAGVSNGVAGLLTALPLLAFAALSPVAPRLARRFGAERVLVGSIGSSEVGRNVAQGFRRPGRARTIGGVRGEDVGLPDEWGCGG